MSQPHSAPVRQTELHDRRCHAHLLPVYALWSAPRTLSLCCCDGGQDAAAPDSCSQQQCSGTCGRFRHEERAQRACKVTKSFNIAS